MEKIVRQIDFLRYLAVAVPTQRKQLLRNLAREQVQVLSEICLNLLNGNIAISDQDYNSLSKHKNSLRKLALKSVDNNTKRELMSKNASVIKTLVTVFLKDFDNGSESSDSSLSDYEHHTPETRTHNSPICRTQDISHNASGGGQRLSEIDSDTSMPVPAVNSKTGTTYQAGETPANGSVSKCFTSHVACETSAPAIPSE